jgi:hypothetical protein
MHALSPRPVVETMASGVSDVGAAGVVITPPGHPPGPPPVPEAAVMTQGQ